MEMLPTLSTEMIIVMLIVVFAIFIFATELLRVDVAALLIMTMLGLLIFVPGLEGLLTTDVLFSGFSSNAVVSIIGVMILGGGLDKTGAMERVAWAILRYGGRTEKQIVALISSTVAAISAFMQNVGAAALFLPRNNSGVGSHFICTFPKGRIGKLSHDLGRESNTDAGDTGEVKTRTLCQ